QSPRLMQLPAFFRRRFGGPVLVAVFGTLLFATGACDPSVSVIKPSDQYRFSLFGTLDVAADTQVIRVEPLSDPTPIGASPDLNASVVLRNLDAGTQVALKDSFEVVSGGVAKVHNVRTTDSILPGTNYRVSVRVDGSAVTTVTTTTPPQPPILEHDPDSTDDKPFLLPCEFNFQNEPVRSENTFTLRASGLDAVAATKVQYPVKLGGQRVASFTQFDHYEDVAYNPKDELYRVSIYYARDLIRVNEQSQGCPSRAEFVEPYAVVTVVSGGPDWPDWRDASLNELARPDTFSNVEGGHGFVGGVYSDTIRVHIRPRN
ncbi:MAG: hypothetical protein ABEL51_10915, partial [Salinibacter sp.]